LTGARRKKTQSSESGGRAEGAEEEGEIRRLAPKKAKMATGDAQAAQSQRRRKSTTTYSKESGEPTGAAREEKLCLMRPAMTLHAIDTARATDL